MSTYKTERDAAAETIGLQFGGYHQPSARAGADWALTQSSVVRGLENSIRGAVMYLRSCGYGKFDKENAHEPEVQMLQDLEKYLKAYEEAVALIEGEE